MKSSSSHYFICEYFISDWGFHSINASYRISFYPVVAVNLKLDNYDLLSLNHNLSSQSRLKTYFLEQSGLLVFLYCVGAIYHQTQESPRAVRNDFFFRGI